MIQVDRIPMLYVGGGETFVFYEYAFFKGFQSQKT